MRAGAVCALDWRSGVDLAEFGTFAPCAGVSQVSGVWQSVRFLFVRRTGLRCARFKEVLRAVVPALPGL